MSDKRTVATDALATLGTIITPAEQRDAIHLAVDNVVAGMTLRAGYDVGFLPDGTVGISDEPVGIVDPFLKTPVQKGQRFWLVVYPGQVTSLRHIWEHPNIPPKTELKTNGKGMIGQTGNRPGGQATTSYKNNKTTKTKAVEYIEDTANQLGVDYQDLLTNAQQYLTSGDYWNMGEKFEGESLDVDEFWDAFEDVTGQKVSEGDRGNFLTCSC